MASFSTIRSGRGFSLVELVLVIFIIAVVGAIAVPRYGRAAERQRLEAAADRVIADFALAQTRARAASSTVTLEFDIDDTSYSFNDVGGDDHTVDLGESPYGVKLARAEFGDSQTVKFNGYGVPEETGKVVLSLDEGTVTIVLLKSGEARR